MKLQKHGINIQFMVKFHMKGEKILPKMKLNSKHYFKHYTALTFISDQKTNALMYFECEFLECQLSVIISLHISYCEMCILNSTGSVCFEFECNQLKGNYSANLRSTEKKRKLYYNIIGGCRGGGPVSFIFMQFSEKILPNSFLVPNSKVGPPSGNPGTATKYFNGLKSFI